ncbi:MAG TPA: ABC transporter permease [Bryobacteraceae bacterium]|nr:ABC transporter permease [Bryobacteraceae bacterium]
MPSRIPGLFFLQNLIERRSLLFQLVRRDFQQRFVGSVAGWVWGLIHPLVLLVTWTYVFSVCLKQKLPDGQPGTYPLFIFAGMLPWLLFSDTVQRSSSSLVEQASLITKTIFPSEMVPLSVFLSSLVSHLLALVLMLVATEIKVRSLGLPLAVLPLYMLLLGMLAVGIGWVVAALQVYLRDTAQFVTVILTAWFWMTPIFIFEDQVPARLRILVYANPLAGVVRAYRLVLLSTRVPGWREALPLAVVSLAVFFLGGLVFRHLKRGFADVL